MNLLSSLNSRIDLQITDCAIAPNRHFMERLVVSNLAIGADGEHANIEVGRRLFLMIEFASLDQVTKAVVFPF